MRSRDFNLQRVFILRLARRLTLIKDEKAVKMKATKIMRRFYEIDL